MLIRNLKGYHNITLSPNRIKLRKLDVAQCSQKSIMFYLSVILKRNARKKIV